MKKFLTFLWFPLLLAACNPVSPASPPPMITRTVTITPIVTSFQPQEIPTTVVTYTSTPSEICPSYGAKGPSVYLDETPAFTVRKGPGCEYEPADSRLFKDNPLALFDILEKQGDWLLVDFCQNKQGWIFVPAIYDTNIHLEPGDFPVTPELTPTKLLSAGDKDSIKQAKDTLVSFFDRLYNKKYEEAAELFSGGYGAIIMWNPDIDPQDHSSLLRTACEYDDFQCHLSVSKVVNEEQVSPMEYHFTVEFIREDGSTYERPNSKGELVSQFSFSVVKDCNDKYLVVDWPFYGY